MADRFEIPISINQAMTYIHQRMYLLPAFQREFVWKAEQIENLFDSLMQGYPIGSFLFWRVTGDAARNQFRFYEFIRGYVENHNTMNADSITPNGDFMAILDGQQRLTALYLGLYGTFASHEPRRTWDYTANSFPERKLYFCVNRENNQEERDRQYIFKFEKTSITNSQDLYNDNNGGLWFRVGKLLDLNSNDEFGLDNFLDENFGQSPDIKRRLRRLNNRIFNDATTINYYLVTTDSADKAVNIFTRINSGGTYLSPSDILFAVLVANWGRISAKEEFDELIKRTSNKGFSIGTDYILRAILFLHHKNIKYALNSFSRNFCETIEDNWNNIRDSIDSLFDLLRSFGLDSNTLTSNNATLPILYYLYHKQIYINYTSTVRYDEERKTIKKWLLSVILRKAFSAQSDTVLNDSRKAFTTDIDTMFISPNIQDFPAQSIMERIQNHLDVVDDNLINKILAYQKDNKYCFSTLAILYPNLDYKNNNFHKDHLHPAESYNNLRIDIKEKYDFYAYNSIVNLQMLDANENESKSNKSLEDWINEKATVATLDSFLSNHLIPRGISLSLDNFAEFYEERKKLLTERLKELLNY